MTLKMTALGLLAGAALIGCGSSDNSDSSSSAPAQPSSSAPKGEVRFVSPKNGAKTGSTVTAKVALKDFHISPKTVGQAPRPGQGHLHFRMDGGKFDSPKYAGLNGQLGKKLGVTGKYSPSLTPSITYRHLPPGKHKLEVLLANNNHTNVGVEAKLKFTVK
jgi:hypothetical protein